MLSFPLANKVEMQNVAIQEAANAKYVLIIARVWPSKTAVPALKDG